jgi:uncharacterized protein (DUF924 family)
MQFNVPGHELALNASLPAVHLGVRFAERDSLRSDLEAQVQNSISPADVIGFWKRAGPKRWFRKDDAFDDDIRTGFATLHMAGARGELAHWARTAEGALALLLLLDQFPRNLYRGSAHAFATDGLAREVAHAAPAEGYDRQVEPELRPFFYLPLEHSERLEDQDRCLALCQAHRDATGDEGTLKWAILHRDIIQRFGRFPHRNASLGRATTPEENAFLDEGGFAG